MSDGTTYDMSIDSCVCRCGGGACIPQRRYIGRGPSVLPQHELQEMVLFSVNGKCGYSLVDALKEQYDGLDGKDDKPFHESTTSFAMRLEVCLSPPARSNNLNSRLQWLPYDKWSKKVGAEPRASLRGYLWVS